ncbi:Rap1a/Tai family immunity protein [Polaromonas sp. JS666]|uniref:Rap1a/Tai family immunity protein n=1 Tax=Polaromonas sp. (strain JS666 / ATCC BAA-500) TaxID=296591 RepID=UPI00352B24F1
MPRTALAQNFNEAFNAIEAGLSNDNFFTGERLYRIGRGPLFTGYVSGVLDAGDLVGEPQKRYCLPPKVTNGQVADVVFKYLEGTPEIRHLGASHAVRMSIRSAWPCAPAK